MNRSAFNSNALVVDAFCVVLSVIVFFSVFPKFSLLPCLSVFFSLPCSIFLSLPVYIILLRLDSSKRDGGTTIRVRIKKVVFSYFFVLHPIYRLRSMEHKMLSTIAIVIEKVRESDSLFAEGTRHTYTHIQE